MLEKQAFELEKGGLSNFATCASLGELGCHWNLTEEDSRADVSFVRIDASPGVI